MKKLTLSLLSAAVIASPTLFASSYSAISSNTNCGGFYVGLSGLYLQPSENNGGLNIDDVGFRNGSESTAHMRRYDFDNTWNYGINLGYDIPCSNNRIDLNYLHFDIDNREIGRTISPEAITVGSYFFTNLIAPNSLLSDFITDGDLDYRFDQFDLTLGHEFKDVIGCFSLRTNIGLRYANIKHEFKAHNSGLILFEGANRPIDLKTDIKSKDDGIGPLLGFDGRYAFCYGFGIVGHFNTALLVGNIQSHSRLHVTIDEFVDDNFRFTLPSTHRIVTALDGKLGLDYNYWFCNRSKLTLEVGYLVSKYYDAVDIIRGDIQSPFVAGSQQRITETVSNNFSFDGPYVNLTFHI